MMVHAVNRLLSLQVSRFQKLFIMVFFYKANYPFDIKCCIYRTLQLVYGCFTWTNFLIFSEDENNVFKLFLFAEVILIYSYKTVAIVFARSLVWNFYPTFVSLAFRMLRSLKRWCWTKWKIELFDFSCKKRCCSGKCGISYAIQNNYFAHYGISPTRGPCEVI